MSDNQFLQAREAFRKSLSNPTNMQRIAIRLIREIGEGKREIYDPSNPVIQLNEISSTGVSALLQEFEAADRSQYPFLATTEEQLYLHMSDEDYIGRFALPASCPFTLNMNYEDLKNLLVEDPEKGYRKMVIPRNSVFTTGNLPFSIPYPIEIRETRYGRLYVVWDVDKPNPIANIATNEIPSAKNRYMQTDYFSFEFQASQYEIFSSTANFTPSSRLSVKANYSDQFYYVKAYISRTATTDGMDLWEEIRTTHTDQVYDPAVITCSVKVFDGYVEATIPLIYINRFKLAGKLRLDVYATRGFVNMDMQSLAPAAFDYKWLAIDPREQNEFVQNLSKLQTVQLWSGSYVNGGRDKIPFDELRERVINGTMGPYRKPITPDQMKTALSDLGYEIIKNVDNLTNRIFLASKQLPPPTNEKLITAASLSIQTSMLNMDEAVDIGTVVNNGDSITITPDTVFQNRGGRTYLVPKDQVDSLRALPGDQQAARVTGGNYYYTPWHYVLHADGNEFDVRAYHLDMPEARNQSFEAENDSTMLQCSIKSYEFRRVKEGYVLDVATSESEEMQDIMDSNVYAQASFRPINETAFAFQNGKIIGRDDDGNRVWRFDLTTNFNVTRGDGLELTKFFMFDQSPKILPINLTEDIHIVFATSDFMPPTWKENEADDALGKFLLPGRIAAITHSKITLKFGDALKNLWVRARTLAGAEKYATYEIDVPAYYLEDVYELDADGSKVLYDSNGKPYFNILHKKGDPQLNEDGTPVIRHPKGSVIKDNDGKPTPISPRKIYQQIDFMLVDAVYFFSTDPIVEEYRIELARLLVSWIQNDIRPLNPDLIEETKIFFYPKTTTGMVEVMYGAGLTTYLPAQQSFEVTLHVDDKVDRDAALKQQLTVKTINVTNNHLQKPVFAVSDVIVDAKNAYGNDVIDIRLRGLGGMTNNFPMISILHLTDRCSLRKRLVHRNDGVLTVEEDITMQFVRHRLDKDQ